MRDILLVFCALVALVGLWLILPDPDLSKQAWEVDVISAGERPVETWHVLGPIERDEEGFLFVCKEHGRFRVDTCMVVAVRKGTR